MPFHFLNYATNCRVLFNIATALSVSTFCWAVLQPGGVHKGRDLLWPPPTLANNFSYFGHDLLWPRPALATTCFGHDLLWPGRLWPRSHPRSIFGHSKGGSQGWEAQNFALFFPSPAPIFILFVSLWQSSRVFSALSGCLLVSFFLSLEVFS